MDHFEALVLREVGVVLDVERGEWELADEAAGCDPRVVRRPGPAAQLGVGLDLAPAGGDVLVVGEDDECSEEGPHRKYYGLNKTGLDLLAESTKTWNHFADTMSVLLLEEEAA